MVHLWHVLGETVTAVAVALDRRTAPPATAKSDGDDERDLEGIAALRWPCTGSSTVAHDVCCLPLLTVTLETWNNETWNTGTPEHNHGTAE
jgi:hypothetical protein